MGLLKFLWSLIEIGDEESARDSDGD